MSKIGQEYMSRIYDDMREDNESIKKLDRSSLILIITDENADEASKTLAASELKRRGDDRLETPLDPVIQIDEPSELEYAVHDLWRTIAVLDKYAHHLHPHQEEIQKCLEDLQAVATKAEIPF